MTTPLVLDLSEEEFQRRYPPVTRRVSSDNGVLSSVIRSLAPGQSVVWDPCLDHSRIGSHSCRGQNSVIMMAKYIGIKVRTWHTREGALVLLRLKEEG